MQRALIKRTPGDKADTAAFKLPKHDFKECWDYSGTLFKSPRNFKESNSVYEILRKVIQFGKLYGVTLKKDSISIYHWLKTPRVTTLTDGSCFCNSAMSRK